MLCHGKTLSSARQQIKKIIAGFSLLETMVVVVIAMILTAISFPIYSHHMITKKRLHAEVTLQQISSALESYFVQNNSYEHFNLQENGFSDSLPHSQYRISVEAESNHYKIIAAPFGAQARRDSRCGTLSITDTGEKQISGSEHSDECWVS